MPTSIGIIGWLDILFNTLILTEISYFPLRVIICDLVSLSTRKRLIINKSPSESNEKDWPVSFYKRLKNQRQCATLPSKPNRR
ncbi:hypothetical protein VCR12J2_1380177 [Vibrio coralliirubri]|nr:hypothetical protein VCR12J2_1380177 [Vibrio coralliirubri]